MGCNCQETGGSGEMPRGHMHTAPKEAAMSAPMGAVAGQTSGETDMEMIEYLRQKERLGGAMAAAPVQVTAAPTGAAPHESRMGGGAPIPGEMPGRGMQGAPAESRMASGPPQPGQMPGGEVNFGELFRATAEKGVKQPPAS